MPAYVVSDLNNYIRIGMPAGVYKCLYMIKVHQNMPLGIYID